MPWLRKRAWEGLQSFEQRLCGRAYDPAVFAAEPVRCGFPAASALHAAKVLECGAIATESQQRVQREFARDRKPKSKKAEHKPRCLEAAVTVWLRSWTDVEQLPLRVSGPRIRRGELPHSAWPPTRSTRRAIPIASVYLAVS